ncbi:MAG TPA: N-acetylmuramidase domain-containing protein [Thermoanaerobaculia bacterium]|nr:N-acetylmuramidase domain-containing protein [Thermoanaerobaculia bacterium]
MATKTGVVTASVLNLRAEPLSSSSLLGTLARGTRVTILETSGAWYRVQAGDQNGFVHGDFVKILDTDHAAGFLNERDDLKNVPLEPSEAEKIQTKASFNGTQKLAAQTWNNQGGLLGALSEIVEVDPAAAVAVLCVESSGRGFGDDGRMIIRFENHVFWDKWGKANADDFNCHFRYNASKKWLGHQFCEAKGGSWSDCHKSQTDEWRVFGFARKLDEPSAIRSISMGGPQVMGFNHHLVGYETPREMFDNFQADLRWQVIGLFDFVKGSGTTSPMLQALQRRRFDDFATRYNGPGQAAEYGGRIQKFYEAFEGLR